MKWALSEVITEVMEAGLTLDFLHEQTSARTSCPLTVQDSDRYFRIPEGQPKIPLTSSLRARKRQ